MSYFEFYWDGGCLATGIEYSGGYLDLAAYGFTAGFFFYGFDPGACDTFVMTFDDGNAGVAENVCNDCATCEELGQIECWDGSEVCDSTDCPDAPLDNTTLWINDVVVEGGEEVEINGGCDLPGNSVYLLGGDVVYNFDDVVAGFQFNIDGTTATGAAGGAAENAGFTVQAAGNVVLGFSFT